MEKTMKKFLIAGAIATFMASSANALETIRVKVPVINTTENYVTQNVRTPQTNCSVVDVPIYGRTSGGASAVIGGMIAADKNQGQQQIVGYRQEERCVKTYVNEQVEKLSGYTVTYELNGQQFTT